MIITLKIKVSCLQTKMYNYLFVLFTNRFFLPGCCVMIFQYSVCHVQYLPNNYIDILKCRINKRNQLNKSFGVLFNNQINTKISNIKNFSIQNYYMCVDCIYVWMCECDLLTFNYICLKT